jgi:hypothetical protein
MKLFFSHSFDPQDKEIIKQFRIFFKKTISGLELIEKEPKVCQIWAEIERLIRDDSQGAIGVLTKFAKHSDLDGWCTRGWLLTETAYCKGLGFQVPVFVEEGISNLGLLGGNNEYMPFTRDAKNGNLKLNKKKAAEYIKSVFNPSGLSYNINQREEFLYVAQNGHGLTEKIISLQTPPNLKFEHMPHNFSLNNPAETQKLPSLSEMQKSDYKERFIKPIFYSEIIGGKKRKIKVVEDKINSTETTKSFKFIFEPNIKYNEKMQYSWGWSCPDMFVTNDLKRDKNKKYDDEFIWSIDYPTSNFFINIFFEKGYPLEGKPWIDIVNRSGDTIKDNEIIGQNSFLCYNKPKGTEFTRHFFNVHQNYLYIVRWKIIKK